MLHPPMKPVARSIKLGKWLSDNVANPFVLTYDDTTGQRQLYQNPNTTSGDPSLPRLPAINFSFESINVTNTN
jgi:hypothetical protein